MDSPWRGNIGFIFLAQVCHLLALMNRYLHNIVYLGYHMNVIMYLGQLICYMIKGNGSYVVNIDLSYWLKGCGMGPLLVLVSPCFRENVVVTFKIGHFLCSLDTLLQKNVIVFFIENQISKWRSFEKRAIFDLLFTFFRYQGKAIKIPSAHILLTYMQLFCSPY